MPLASPLRYAGRPRQAKWLTADVIRPGALTRSLAFAAFVGLLLANISLNSFRVGGVPIRGIVAAGLLVVLAVLYSDVAKLALKRNLLLLGFAGGLAFLGIVVSVANQTPLGDIIKGVTEVHVQAAVTIMVTAMLAHICGARACVFGIVAIVGISVCVAVAQMLDIHSAWSLRRALGPLPNELVKGLVY